MWSIFPRNQFNQEKLKQRYKQAQQLLIWRDFGWSLRDLQVLLRHKLDLSDDHLGSPTFKILWQNALTSKPAKELLTILLNMAALPDDLSGDLADNQFLVGRFSADLAPDDAFWSQLAELVHLAFPAGSLSQPDELAKKVHQLRYVISSQQAQYVRQHFRKADMTDGQALARFLKGKRQERRWRKNFDFTLTESARLHNKVSFEEGEIIYPDGQMSVNIKILLGFHTEFILDSQGNFLNEVDAEKVSQKGIINGASFNYASRNDSRHRQLDINPVKVHDPQFRKLVCKDYRSPNNGKVRLLKKPVDYEHSYFNKRGLYAVNNRSPKKLIDKETRSFKRQIRIS